MNVHQPIEQTLTANSSGINELAAALAKAQGRMSNAIMNRTNPHFKSRYADLSSVLDAIREPLSSANLSVTQTMHFTEGGMLVLRTTLMHSSGQSIFTEYPLPPTQKPHEMGSALTYARRYSLSALICNSSDEDDDGNSAMAAKPTGKSGAGAGRITEEQLQQLIDLADDVGADKRAFCEYLGVDALASITAENFPRAMAALNKKRAKA